MRGFDFFIQNAIVLPFELYLRAGLAGQLSSSDLFDKIRKTLHTHIIIKNLPKLSKLAQLSELQPPDPICLRHFALGK